MTEELQPRLLLSYRYSISPKEKLSGFQGGFWFLFLRSHA